MFYFAGGNGGPSMKIELRYSKYIDKRFYSYHFPKTCELIMELYLARLEPSIKNDQAYLYEMFDIKELSSYYELDIHLLS